MKAESEDGHGGTLRGLQRRMMRTDLALSRLLDHLGIDDVTDDEVDVALDPCPTTARRDRRK